jgi:hypothetical protein
MHDKVGDCPFGIQGWSVRVCLDASAGAKRVEGAQAQAGGGSSGGHTQQAVSELQPHL